MKFGHNLPKNQVPEWASAYIDYKGLKKQIKSVSESAQSGKDVDLAEFFFLLDRNLEDVDAFYNKKHAELARRLKLLVDMYDRAKQSPESMDRDEVEDLMGALLELRGQLRKLQWYGEMNRRGFVKITKKLDKKVPDSNNQHRYLRTKVDPKAFTTNRGVIEYLRTVNDWLSKIGEIKTFDDSGSAASSSSRRHPLTRALRNTSPEQLQKIDDAINSDDATSLAENVKFLEKNDDSLDSSLPALLLNFLQRSISLSSRGCILVLLSKVQTLDEDDDINSRNCIHRLVISIGRGSSNAVGNASEFLNGNSTMSQNFIVPATSPMLAPRPCNALEEELALKLNEDNSSVRLLEFLLENLQGNQRSALKARDTYGRTPLHYAAQHGLAVICQIIMVFMRRWKQMDYGNGWVAKEWQDQEGYTPLHLSVIGLHALTTKALLDRVHTYDSENGEHIVEKFDPSYGGVLALATKANSVSIVRMLVHASIEVNYQDDQGETPLHIAARHGYVECAKVLIEEPSGQAVHLDVSERIFGWTPLFIACVDGHLPMVELLIKAGADATRPDGSGWTAKEHAALRGFINIAEYLHKLNPHPSAEPSSASKETSSPRQGPSLEERRSNGMGKDVNAARPEPVKTFGHKYLTKETMILVTLGTLDTRKIIPAVSFDNISLADAHATQLDTALSIVVSATGATGDPTVIDLPIEESISTDPITFMTMDASKVKLLFDIIPTYAGQKEKVVGRGVALLSSVKPNIGSKRITLQGDVSVPIVAATNLEVIGSVNFNFLLITPFSHPNIAITAERTYWKSVASTMIIGHRGMGKNRTSHRSLQLGENTIESFISAASLGAQYVEFDVQLTKDHVPVIYHDFLVSETGIDAPVHTLTLEQFLHVNNLKSAHPSRQTSPEDLRRRAKDPPNSSSNRPRSYSVGMTDDKHSSDMNERMKHTRDFKLKGFKSNTRGHFIQQPFATLEELFQKLPENLGFNIEMKYPMLHESEEQGMDVYAVELNSFVDTVLEKVYELGTRRNILFSSFNPDICLALSFKQPSIPVLFLTDAGTAAVGDIRATSLQEAIRFATRWNLLGIVTASEPLVLCPRLIRIVKESGLVLFSYGTQNNESENALLQKREGIDAVIVDTVFKIRKGLLDADDDAGANASGITGSEAANGVENAQEESLGGAARSMLEGNQSVAVAT